MDNVFGKRLKFERLNLGLTRYAFSKLVGCAQVEITNYERGDIAPNLYRLVILAEVLNVSLDWLTGLSNKRGELHAG